MKRGLSTGRPADPLASKPGVRGITFRYSTAEGSTRRYQFSILALGNVTATTSFHASLSMLNQQSEAPRVIEGRDTMESRYALTVTERVKNNGVYRDGRRRPTITSLDDFRILGF
jgi:hypothetical protein